MAPSLKIALSQTREYGDLGGSQADLSTVSRILLQRVGKHVISYNCLLSTKPSQHHTLFAQAAWNACCVLIKYRLRFAFARDPCSFLYR